MSRLMSVSHTADAVIARTKTVTRRKGWTFLRPGDRLTLCRKVMGRKPGEPLVRLAEVEVIDVRRQALVDFGWNDIAKEGVPVETITPHGDPHELICASCQRANWIGWFARTMRVPVEGTQVTRIEWRYL